jgi:nucleoporin p58/p45
VRLNHRFFRRKAEELASRLETYKSSIEQIQSQLSRSDPDQVKGERGALRKLFVRSKPDMALPCLLLRSSAILPTLKAQHAATLQLAGKLSSLEGSVTELRDEYRDLWRERTGSVRDPFIERRRQVLGVEDGVLDSVGGLSIR